MRDESNLLPRIAAQHWNGGPDVVVAAVAERQYGVIWRAQLTAVGLTRHQIAGRMRAGRLHRLYRGVYAVGHRAIPREGQWLAAGRACGTDAGLSHGSAAALWKLRLAKERQVDVSVSKWRSGPRGVIAHHTMLDPDEITTRQGIPATT